MWLSIYRKGKDQPEHEFALTKDNAQENPKLWVGRVKLKGGEYEIFVTNEED